MKKHTRKSEVFAMRLTPEQRSRLRALALPFGSDANLVRHWITKEWDQRMKETGP